MFNTCFCFWTLGLKMISEYKLSFRQLHCSRNYLITNEGIENIELLVFVYSILLLIHTSLFSHLCEVGFMMGSLLMNVIKTYLLWLFSSSLLHWHEQWCFILLIWSINYSFNDLLLKLLVFAYLFCLLTCTSFY